MPAALIAHQQPISRVFSNDYVFSIPSYQRPYAWTTEQARDLFDDLVGFMSARPGEVEEMPPYFLGSIVLIKAENLPNADVVDGQQRLTTLTLLLSAIRANTASQNAADITQLIYEKGSQILGTQDRFRLSLRERDREFFQRYVQREDGISRLIALEGTLSDSQKNLRDNARLLDDKIKALPTSERPRLAQFVVTRCYLVVVATPDLDSAYRIFSVLNTRGLELSATDILKAEIIGGIPIHQRDSYTSRWEDTEEDLGRNEFGDVFSYIRMIYRKAKPQGTLLSEFRDHVTKSMSGIDFINKVLLPMAAVYEQLADAAYASTTGAELVNERLKWLNRLEFNDWMPPALAFAVRYQGSSEAMGRFFCDLERLAYALLITRTGINERIDRFSRLTNSVEQGDDLYADLSPLQLTGAEQNRTYEVLSGAIYETLSARARSAVLLRLDALLSGGGATYDYQTITVEHVLPQNPHEGSDWLVWFQDPAVREKFVHTLGNLALLTRKKNSAASNYDFERKKTAYFAQGGVSPFVITTQVLQHTTWTPAIVGERQEELLQKLETHWRLQGRSQYSRPLGLSEIADQIDLADQERTWRDDVREGLRRLGGRATLNRIYSEVETIRRAAGRTVPKSFDAVVRRTLEENSSDSDVFKGGSDIFTMPDGRGAGMWALRSRTQT
ncbi:MAG TPA: DUF262 domain-containing protein [Stellaceae bacterium]|nr:DUF262 domain-containing protein [Stellaceae bacterium]